MNLSALVFSEYRAATYLFAAAMGWFATYLLTPIVRKAAIQLNFVDKPGGRKTQAKPVALGGGVAVFGGALAAVAAAFLFADVAVNHVFFEGDARTLAGIAVAAAATLVLGLYDDATNMRGRYKLIGQLLIAGMLVYLGLRMDRFELFGTQFSLGWMAIPFSLFWLVGSTNAINLLDGIDGLASGIGMVLCLTLATINVYNGNFPEAVVMLALAGALIGFLRYNFAPATIYLGDAGSMVIGLVIGAIAMHTRLKSSAFAMMVVPLAVWAVPILDTGAAIIRRRLTGRSVFAPDRGHLHHSLLTRGWSVPQASVFITLICAVTCLSAILGVLWRNEWIVVATVAFVIVFLIGSKTFGHIEFALLSQRMRPTALMGRPTADGVDDSRHGVVRLQGSHEWETMWASLVEAAPTYGLTKMQLTIHMPSVHEAFFARWKAPKAAPPSGTDASWRLTQPLIVDGESVGKLELIGHADGAARSTPSQLAQLMDFLDPLEDDIRRVKEALTAGPEPPSPSDAAPSDSDEPASTQHDREPSLAQS